MTNEKLGVLLVDVPEPRYFKYYYIKFSETEIGKTYDIFWTDYPECVEKLAYRCTREEAQKYPQFRWVALEDLE
ncbi:TPA: hypothetical protein ACIRI2_001989 [Streptococcus suis]|nr:hypothetical protein [Streptococcus suis]HEL1675827.1 hypothetical protein [Streptococcus suis]HEM2714201.1 hypothetical protein [Streptococcus suis]HEP1783681.1 hypothetical protein [Streptococcus suis]